MEKLSSKVFLPTEELRDLDLSNCNLKTLWSDLKRPIFQNLTTLNVSNNEIEQIRVSDLEGMDKLSVMDVSNNKLKCDKQFKELVAWMAAKKVSFQMFFYKNNK